MDKGSRPVLGDMRNPASWLSDLDRIDGCRSFGGDFRRRHAGGRCGLLDGLLEHLSRQAESRGTHCPFVYTGGVWLYGPVGDNTAVEGSPFDPPPEFAFMVEHRERLFASPQVSARVVHPAMVWDESGGVIRDFLARAERGLSPEITGNADARWPLVHRDDVARLYVAALERGERCADYHGVVERGVPVGRFVSAISRRYDAPDAVVVSSKPPLRRWGRGGLPCLRSDNGRAGDALGARMDAGAGRYPRFVTANYSASRFNQLVGP